MFICKKKCVLFFVYKDIYAFCLRFFCDDGCALAVGGVEDDGVSCCFLLVFCVRGDAFDCFF